MKVIAGAAVALVGIALIVGVVALVTSKDTPSKRTSRSTTTSTSTTTTTVPTSTTVVPKSANPVVALAQQYDGFYEGTFTNSTFNTTGKVTLELRIDPAASTLAVTSDIDGDVFGRSTEERRTIKSTTKIGDPNARVTTETEAFGEVTSYIDASLALVLSAPDVPDRRVQSFDLTGRLRPDRSGFDATYHVVFENGDTADGVITVVCSARGPRPSEVATLCTPPAA
jgi:hypothetical protein